ncbi:FAD/NAD(P)-binding protein [Glarea lozoyensis ATCC 20868]|uniref:FAD/NAD(P)-binding protein n=1 Tax=Glarea lozoyensis (strain ATCC 20868 / MF5171) TaxID=1116229 RepID=S3E6J5_GLAL2|nr:FAD/NAD(P)-binding protein [Glarea lozoyensis ATCC 20868]EPE34003.1 FAD/NAD(P)-binding protein [Glarea lozoyensis ATCC 20868]
MESTTPPPIRIAIIGAGIAGLTLANALKTKNPSINLTIYESRLRFSEISAAVAFGPNAVRALSLISPELADAYHSVAVPNLAGDRDLWYTIRDGMSGKVLRKVEMRGGFEYGSASRSKFLARLVEMLPGDVEVQFGKRIVDVEELEGEGMRMRFEDGSEAWADAVVGCDGIRSRSRRLLLGDDDLGADAVYSGKYAYRKVLSMKTAIAAVGEGLLNRQMFVGKSGHVLTHPINNGNALNVVAFRDADGVPWKQRQWVVPSSKEAVLKDFDGWGGDVVKILQLVEDPEKWGLFDTTPARTYNKGNFCILGDAAHASTPHLDAGAGFAVEDVYILSSLLTEKLVASASDLKHAFSAWSQIRRPRCEELINRSRRQGILLELTKEEGFESGEEELLDDLEHNQEWVWDVDLEKMLEQSISMLDISKEDDAYPPVF